MKRVKTVHMTDGRFRVTVKVEATRINGTTSQSDVIELIKRVDDREMESVASNALVRHHMRDLKIEPSP